MRKLREYKVSLSKCAPGEHAVDPDGHASHGRRTKLGGEPDWEQSDEHPECASFFQPMSFVAQIDSVEHWSDSNPHSRNPIKQQQDFMFGDVGMIQKDFNDTVTELTRDELTALERDTKRVPAFIAEFVSPEHRTGETLEDLDLAFAAWLPSGRRDAYTSNDVIRIVGCALGAHAIQHLGVRWARVTDTHGSDIALVAEHPLTRSFPFSSVQYRIEDQKTDFIVALFRTLEHAMKSASK